MNVRRPLGGPASTPALRVRPLAVAVAAALAGALVGTGAYANPTGARVVSGSASIVSAGPVLNVTNSPGAVINWQSFGVSAGETTRFIQPYPGSAVINRILPGGLFSPANVLSNGQVFFLSGSMLTGGAAGVNLDFSALSLASLRLKGPDAIAAGARAVPRPGASEQIRQEALTTIQNGQVYVLAPYAEAVRRTGAGDLMVEPGRSVELTDLRWPHIRVEITAPRDRALNVSELVAKNGQIFSSLVARTSRDVRRSENEATAIAAASFGADPGSMQPISFNIESGGVLRRTTPDWAELASVAKQWMLKRVDQPAAEGAVPALAAAEPAIAAAPTLIAAEPLGVASIDSMAALETERPPAWLNTTESLAVAALDVAVDVPQAVNVAAAESLMVASLDSAAALETERPPAWLNTTESLAVAALDVSVDVPQPANVAAAESLMVASLDSAAALETERPPAWLNTTESLAVAALDVAVDVPQAVNVAAAESLMVASLDSAAALETERPPAWLNTTESLAVAALDVAVDVPQPANVAAAESLMVASLDNAAALETERPPAWLNTTESLAVAALDVALEVPLPANVAAAESLMVASLDSVAALETERPPAWLNTTESLAVAALDVAVEVPQAINVAAAESLMVASLDSAAALETERPPAWLNTTESLAVAALDVAVDVPQPANVAAAESLMVASLDSAAALETERPPAWLNTTESLAVAALDVTISPPVATAPVVVAAMPAIPVEARSTPTVVVVARAETGGQQAAEMQHVSATSEPPKLARIERRMPRIMMDHRGAIFHL